MTEYGVLLFPDRRVDGAFPVIDAAGDPVATITAAWSRGRFTATAADGTTLCAGVTSRWWLTGRWQVSGAGGAPLLTVTARPLRNAALVTLARGGEFEVRGSPWRRDFTLTDHDGHTVLSGAPRTSALSPRQHDYAVSRPAPDALTVAEVIAVVQVWRMAKKSDAAVLAATTATATAAGS